MTEEARAARNRYKRDWSKRNPDKVRAYQERHWEKRANSERSEESKKSG